MHWKPMKLSTMERTSSSDRIPFGNRWTRNVTSGLRQPCWRNGTKTADHARRAILKEEKRRELIAGGWIWKSRSRLDGCDPDGWDWVWREGALKSHLTGARSWNSSPRAILDFLGLSMGKRLTTWLPFLSRPTPAATCLTCVPHMTRAQPETSENVPNFRIRHWISNVVLFKLLWPMIVFETVLGQIVNIWGGKERVWDFKRLWDLSKGVEMFKCFWGSLEYIVNIWGGKKWSLWIQEFIVLTKRNNECLVVFEEV